MARLRLQCIGASGNSYKLALFMNCAGVDREPVGVDFAGGATRERPDAPAPMRWAKSRCSKLTGS